MERFAGPDIERVARPGGGFILRSRTPLPAHPRCLGDSLARWAADAPDRAFLGERRGGEGAWHTVTYREAYAVVRAIAADLLARGLSVRAPLAILSGNSIDHALLALAAMHVGVPVAPISPAYSLASADHRKLIALVACIAPGAVFADDARGTFAPALAALSAAGVRAPVIDLGDLRALSSQSAAESSRVATPSAARATAVDAAAAAVTGDTVAKLLFTSGSTGEPRAVVNTQRMLCANQAALAAGWPFLARAERPPVIVDWLPWSHTFGANHNFNLVLTHGGTLYIDAGKPAPGAFATTIRSLREIPSTIYFNVPRGYDLLVDHLETDAALRETFFRELDVIFYAAAALSPATWRRLEAVAQLARPSARPAMTSAWGSTETSPLVTQVCFAIDRAGVIGVPIPGTELAFAPAGDQLELRVRGPSVAPGYRTADGAITPLPRDELGFYPMGDAGRLADDRDPNAGVVFDGRTSENFKLSTGTWVHVGAVRLALVAAASPRITDAVICGHDRAELGALIWLAPTAPTADLAPTADIAPLWAALAAHAHACESSSTRITRVAILREPPSIDAGEITDKGYTNQRAVLARRAAEVERLYAAPDWLATRDAVRSTS